MGEQIESHYGRILPGESFLLSQSSFLFGPFRPCHSVLFLAIVLSLFPRLEFICLSRRI